MLAFRRCTCMYLLYGILIFIPISYHIRYNLSKELTDELPVCEYFLPRFVLQKYEILPFAHTIRLTLLR